MQACRCVHSLLAACWPGQSSAVVWALCWVLLRERWQLAALTVRASAALASSLPGPVQLPLAIFIYVETILPFAVSHSLASMHHKSCNDP